MLDFIAIEFMRNPFLAALIMAAVLVPLGIYVHLRRIIFVGIAAPQTAALGAVVGVILGWPTFWPALLFAWVSIVLLAPLSRARQISRGAVLALFYIMAVTVSLLLLASNPSAETEVANVFFGNVLTVGIGDVLIALAAAVPIIAILLLLNRRIAFSLFDHDSAEVAGVKPKLSEFVFYLLLGLSVALSMRMLGVLLTFALLALPAMFGLLWAKRTWQALLAGLLLALLSLYLGFGLSYDLDWPTGPAVVAPLTVITFVAVVIKSVFAKRY